MLKKMMMNKKEEFKLKIRKGRFRFTKGLLGLKTYKRQFESRRSLTREEAFRIQNVFKGFVSLRMMDLQKKKSGSHFLYDLNVLWADTFVTPLPF